MEGVVDMGAKGTHHRTSGSEVRSQAWTSMRVMRRFTVGEIVATGSIGEDNARRYVRALERAGYLTRVRDVVIGEIGSCIIYGLVRDTGPLAPIAWLTGGCYDPNKRRAFGLPDPSPDQQRIVSERCVRHGDNRYTAAELTLHEGAAVMVRPVEGAPDRLYIFDLDGCLLATAERRAIIDRKTANDKAARLRKQHLGSERPRRRA